MARGLQSGLGTASHMIFSREALEEIIRLSNEAEAKKRDRKARQKAERARADAFNRMVLGAMHRLIHPRYCIACGKDVGEWELGMVPGCCAASAVLAQDVRYCILCGEKFEPRKDSAGRATTERYCRGCKASIDAARREASKAANAALKEFRAANAPRRLSGKTPSPAQEGFLQSRGIIPPPTMASCRNYISFIKEGDGVHGKNESERIALTISIQKKWLGKRVRSKAVWALGEGTVAYLSCDTEVCGWTEGPEDEKVHFSNPFRAWVHFDSGESAGRRVRLSLVNLELAE